jgi:hypothetical protein
MARTDAALLAAARTDAAAFRELYERYAEPVHAFHLRRTAPADPRGLRAALAAPLRSRSPPALLTPRGPGTEGTSPVRDAAARLLRHPSGGATRSARLPQHLPQAAEGVCHQTRG